MQLGFIDVERLKSVSPVLLHDLAILHIICVSILVILLIFILFAYSWVRDQYIESPFLETAWTIFPAIILIVIAVPSLIRLYSLESEIYSSVRVKVIAHQWYWSYDYRDIFINFDSFIVASPDLRLGDFRIMDVDSNCVVPFLSPIQILVTRADVIHSFALPNLAVKIDCNPGYLSSIYFQFESPGIFYGLCRELCGVGHSAIRICLESTCPNLFKLWANYIIE